MKACRIEDVVRPAVANASHMRGAGQCEFVVDVPESLPPILGDRAQLVQVLDNLLNNAVRYGCDRPDSQIEISVARDERWLTLTVTDHGPGIPREHLPRITERFYRVDAARSRESGGTGLGLAIVKHIVERHRGSLEINSTYRRRHQRQRPPSARALTDRSVGRVHATNLRAQRLLEAELSTALKATPARA